MGSKERARLEMHARAVGEASLAAPRPSPHFHEARCRSDTEGPTVMWLCGLRGVNECSYAEPFGIGTRPCRRLIGSTVEAARQRRCDNHSAATEGSTPMSPRAEIDGPPPRNGGECPQCGRIMSVREGCEQGICNDCLG